MTRRLRDDDGLTLVELLVTMTISIVVLVAVLNLFDGFNDASATLDRRTEVQDEARQTVDSISREIRGATPILDVTSDALVPTRSDSSQVTFNTYNNGLDASGTTARRVRFCLNTTTNTLYRETAAALSDPGTACPSTASGWTHATLLNDVLNSASAPLFSYGTNNRAVSVNLQVAGTKAGRKTTISTAVAPRASSGRTPVTKTTDYRITCSADKNSALIELASSVDDSGESVTANFFQSVSGGTSTPLGKNTIQLRALQQATATTPATFAGVKASVTNALGKNSPLIDLLVSCP